MFSSLRRIGKVLHLSSSRSLILKTEKQVNVGSRVLDSRLKEVGRVHDMFGPVASPYISVRPTVADPSSLVGKILYVADDSD